jgi:hypothetical protein
LAIDVGNAAQDAAALGWRPDGNVKRFGEEASSIQPEINILRRNADGGLLGLERPVVACGRSIGFGHM